ncbi:hypothetical protein DXA21_21425 [Parabacteroides distasonis]|nr:hypothetical protein DXA21_21425 [Parabacteroides distasonis]
MFHKVMATRQFWIKDANGGYIVKAESIWSLLDLAQVRLKFFTR